MSVNLPFILVAVAELSLSEAVVIAAVSALVQGLPARGKSLKAMQTLFNVSILVGAVTVADLVFRRSTVIPGVAAKSLLIALAGAAFLLADTLPVAAVISLTENLSVVKVWGNMVTVTFPYFALSAGVAAIAATATHYVGWRTPLVVLPVMITTYASYKHYFRFPALAVANLQFATLPAGARAMAESKAEQLQ
jgi:MASE9